MSGVQRKVRAWLRGLAGSIRHHLGRIGGVLDADDRKALKVLAQVTVVVVVAVLGLITFAAAAGVALAIFRATGGL